MSEKRCRRILIINTLAFGVLHLENRKLPLRSLHKAEFYILWLSNEFCNILSHPQIKTELEPHCITLPEFYMNLIKLGRGTNSPDHLNIGSGQIIVLIPKGSLLHNVINY